MQCPTCARNIPEDSRFCLYCGSTLEGSPAPRRPPLDGLALLRNYIPSELAERILTAGKQIESERRLVTVVFADVTGFTALSEGMDPEDVSAILNDCFAALVSTVLRYEGTIDKFIGDGIMAIFGAPLAHENDPERALRCAVDMMADIERFNVTRGAALAGPLGLHVGVHSGMVIAGNVGSDLRMEYSVIGDTVNLASRLVEIAPRGKIYCSSDTFKLVASVVNAEGPVSTSLRGKPTPVQVYSILSIKSEAERRPPAMGHDNFVGREGELRIIQDALDAVMHQQQVRLAIRGEPGVGKSRLKAELVRMAYQKSLFPVEGACSSFETTTPYYVWTVLLRGLLKVRSDASEAQTRERLDATLGSLGLQAHGPYLATLLSIRYGEIMLLEERVRKQRIFQAVRSLLSAFSKGKPTVFVIEDLHWIDRFSQELLDFIFAQQEEPVASLFVLTFRTEYRLPAAYAEGGVLIDLNRLSSADARRLIIQRLNTGTVAPEIEEFILRRSEGNPFFIQEIIKTLLDKQVVAVKNHKAVLLTDNIESGVPSTIQGVIMARIDRLQDRFKEILFGASVIGREFSKPLLERVVGGRGDLDPSLAELRSLELILEKEEAREYEYLFKHFLIQEVAYNTMLVNKRKELHASIARAIEQLYPDRLMEYYELLAFHYEKAELWDKAAEYLSRSGHKVRQMYSRDESESFFERKEIAVKELYQSRGARAGVLATVLAILPPLLAMLIPILPIFALISIIGSAQSGDVVTEIVIGALASLMLIWYALTLWYLWVVPFLRGRPTLYDLMEDRVRIIFKDRTSLSVHFSEIERLRLWDAKANSLRPLRYRILDPLGRLDPSETLTMASWIRNVLGEILPPYAFGVGTGGSEIHVRLNSGASMLRFLLPWLNAPMHSRVLALHPSDTKEFYVQFEVALMKWGKQQI